MPFYYGRPTVRHSRDYDYLCHLQAVVEKLQQYNQLLYVLHQIGKCQRHTNKIDSAKNKMYKALIWQDNLVTTTTLFTLRLRRRSLLCVTPSCFIQ